jgi:hypothetical protein
MGEVNRTYKTLVSKPNKRRTLKITERYNITMNLKERGF